MTTARTRPARRRAVPAAALLLLACCGAQLLQRAASADADTYRPKGWVTGDVWQFSGASSFVYPELSSGPYGMPELQKRPSLGIAVRRCCMRACTPHQLQLTGTALRPHAAGAAPGVDAPALVLNVLWPPGLWRRLARGHAGAGLGALTDSTMHAHTH